MIIVYHRVPTFISVEGINQDIEYIKNVLRERLEKPINKMIVEQVDYFKQQKKLEELQQFVTSDDKVYCLSFINLTNGTVGNLIDCVFNLPLEFIDDPEAANVLRLLKRFKHTVDIEQGHRTTHNLKANGMTVGRRDTVTKEKIKEAIELRENGLSYSEIARRLDMSKTVVYDHLPKEVKNRLRLVNIEKRVRHSRERRFGRER